MTEALVDLRLRQLDELLAQYRSVGDPSPPHRGWINELRRSLRMTAEALGKRLGVSQSAVSQLEESESDGKITLNSLRKAAQALGGELVYAIVPHQTLEDTLQRQLHRLAVEQIERISYTMALEDQRVDTAKTERQLEELMLELTHRPPRNLWP